jgi:hypothetical protein
MGNSAIQRCYWNNKGRYQNIYNKLNKELVPSSGSPVTVQGELIRAVGRLYYDYCNNGNCNAKDEKWEWVGTGTYETYWDEELEEEVQGEEEGEEECVDISLNKFYESFLRLINEVIPETEELTQNVADVICQDSACTFTGGELQTYIDLTDRVVSWVARNKNTELTFPTWYDKD